MQKNPTTIQAAPVIPSLNAIKLEDFGELTQRYQALSLPRRAQAVLMDAEVALKTADRILSRLSAHPSIGEAFSRIRANAQLVGKMRPSEARNILTDSSTDFIDVARHKLAVWRKTMERIAQGEGILFDHQRREYISSQVPLAMAITSASTASTYLSVIQLVFQELEKMHSAEAHAHQVDAAKIRRCATFLSDCENAACFREVVH